MANCRQPIRTYQRKTVRKPLINISLVPSIVSTQEQIVQNDYFNNNENCDDSLIHNPFETTFDRIAKGAIVPPLPLDANQNDSWNSSSSDSDINNVTNLGKSFKNILCNSPICDDMSNLTNKNIKHTHKCKKSQKYIMEVISEPERVHKRKKVISKKTDKIQGKTKIQVRKIQTNNIQRQKVIQYKLKSNHKYNRHICRSDITSDLKNAIQNDISCDYNDKCLPEKVLKTNKDTSIISQTTSNCAHDSMVTSKHTLNYYKNIKPCFVKLDSYTVQSWYMSNRKKIVDSTDEVNETHTSHLAVGHNLCKTTSHCNTSIDNVIFNAEKNKAYLIKDIFIKVERLNTEKFTKEKVTLLNEKEKYMVSSTPIGKHMRPSAYPVLLSPIKNIHDTPNTKYKNSVIIAKKNTIDTSLERKDSICSLIASGYYKTDITNIQQQQTQVLLPSQKLSLATDFVKNKTISCNEDIHSAVKQKYKAQSDIRTELPRSLNISASTDQSRSLFGDTIYNCDYSMENIVGHNIEKKWITDAENKSAKILNATAALYLPTDLNLEQKKGLLINNVSTDISTEYVKSPKIRTLIKTKISEDLNDIGHTKQEYKDQEKQCTEMNSMEIVCKKSKNETVSDNKDGSFSNSRDELSINAADVHVLLTKLQDPIRITKRMRYSKWHQSVLSISKNLSNRYTLSNNEMLHNVTTNACSNIPTIDNLEHSKNVINSSLDYSKLFDNAIRQRYSNDTNMQVQRSVFLKPGKCWARSLSILSNVNPESDLNKLCVGKGKKWRHSVKHILDMQKQGNFGSCLKKYQDDKNLSCGGFNTSIVSSLSDNRCKTANYGRFPKRISVRVVLNNNASIECDINNAPFLEAFGVTMENLPMKLKTLYEKKLSIHNIEYDNKDQIFRSHLATAKDIVLQRCTQTHYLPFSDCFPDSYLEHCRKIGEGVYGEVFLYEHDDEKSVIKIIPIEGEELVNGEPQKKFSEILSEIVIAEELHNLRLHSTYRTSAFVEVRSIKCIIGKYPKKLVKLWNIYDDDKTSDNDCPSMFGKHQLYIVLELGHGGEDLEAFVFQTAEEAYTLFLQTALALAIAEKAFEFEHRDLHWGNVLISRTKESYECYNFDGKEIKFPNNNVKVSIIDYTLSRMVYQGCCIYNDLALDPALFTARGEYQFEIYRLMRDKIQNNWQKFEPYTNILWLHYTLDKMITAVRYKRKNLKVHKQAIKKLKELKETILNYDSAYNFVSDSNSVMQCMSI